MWHSVGSRLEAGGPGIRCPCFGERELLPARGPAPLAKGCLWKGR